MLTVGLGWDKDHYSLKASTGELALQPLPRRTGWHELTIDFTADRLLVDIDRELLASGAGSLGKLEQIRVVSRSNADPRSIPDADSAESCGYLNDLKLYARRQVHPQSTDQETQDALFLGDSVEVNGQIERFDARGVLLRTGGQSRLFERASVRGMALARRPSPPAPAICGQWASVETVPLGLPAEPDQRVPHGDRLQGVITDLSETTLQFEHPVLGRIPIPLRLIDCIRPLARGCRVLLEPNYVHLGDGVYADATIVAASAPVESWAFELNEVPAGEGWLSLDLFPLERPNASSRSDPAEQGAVCQVSINGRKLGDLCYEPGSERIPIRLPVPIDALRPGSNRLELRAAAQSQQPPRWVDLGVEGIVLELRERPASE